MFHQLLTPVGDSLLLSFAVAAIPIIVVLIMLGVLKRPSRSFVSMNSFMVRGSEIVRVALSMAWI